MYCTVFYPYTFYLPLTYQTDLPIDLTYSRSLVRFAFILLQHKHPSSCKRHVSDQFSHKSHKSWKTQHNIHMSRTANTDHVDCIGLVLRSQHAAAPVQFRLAYVFPRIFVTHKHTPSLSLTKKHTHTQTHTHTHTHTLSLLHTPLHTF